MKREKTQNVFDKYIMCFYNDYKHKMYLLQRRCKLLVKLDDRKIHMLMYDLGIKQVKLSELSGVSRPAIAKAIKGKPCKEETGRKICEALRVDIHEYATFNRF